MSGIKLTEIMGAMSNPLHRFSRCVILLAILIALPFFISLDDYIPQIEKAASAQVPVEVLSSAKVQNGTAILELLGRFEIEVLVLAGYLKMIPPEVIQAFRGKILNIHPSLLPDFGGKGMFGKKVHEAVLKAGKNHSARNAS